MPKTLCFSEYILHLFFVFSCGIDPNIFGVSFNSILKELKKMDMLAKPCILKKKKFASAGN